MLSFILLNVIMLSVIILSVIILSFIMLSVIVLIVVVLALTASGIKSNIVYSIDTRGLYYKTFYGRNLQIFVISYSVCPWQAFQA
jgi:hypothetical protein